MSTTDTTTLLLLAVAVLLLVIDRWPRWQAKRAVRAMLRCYPTLNNRRAYRRLTASRDGLAVSLLLLNAAAKQHTLLYRRKVPLLRAVVAASDRGEWWMERHDHEQATTYRNTYIVFVETTIGQILDIPRVQLSAHVSAEDAARHFAGAPEPGGRRWSGIPLQARAEEIARAFVSR
jgi:hypothetical protein